MDTQFQSTTRLAGDAVAGQPVELQLIAVAGAYGVPLALRQQAGQAGPVLRDSELVPALRRGGVRSRWQALVGLDEAMQQAGTDEALRALCAALQVELQNRPRHALPVVLTGDHALAVGTWCGLAGSAQRAPGLLWIDAHLDAHTLTSSHTGNRHGMPLATLLGCTPNPWHITQAVVAASHCCVLGARSFEPAEWQHLQALGVRVITREEIHRRGLPACFTEALQHVSRQGHPFGISLDLDAIDPGQVMAVNTPVADGLAAEALCAVLQGLLHQPGCLGLEIAEYNPARDLQGRTQQWMVALLLALAGGSVEVGAV